MDLYKLDAFAGRCEAQAVEWGHLFAAHPVFFGAGLLFLLMTWSHFRGTFGPHVGALPPDKPVAVRGLAYVAVLPFRLLASLFSSAVALLVIALLISFVYVVWRVAQG